VISVLEVDDSAAAMMERGSHTTFTADQRLPRARGSRTRDLDALNNCNPTCLLAGQAKVARRDIAYFVGLATPGLRSRAADPLNSSHQPN
jgi:hypothetical protein